LTKEDVDRITRGLLKLEEGANPEELLALRNLASRVQFPKRGRPKTPTMENISRQHYGELPPKKGTFIDVQRLFSVNPKVFDENPGLKEIWEKSIKDAAEKSLKEAAEK
jgi:hypothetical protein